jgi:hypothetical protein
MDGCIVNNNTRIFTESDFDGAQVLVGSIIGSIDGIAWFWATDYRWDLIEALDRSLVSSSFAAPAIW